MNEFVANIISLFQIIFFYFMKGMDHNVIPLQGRRKEIFKGGGGVVLNGNF